LKKLEDDATKQNLISTLSNYGGVSVSATVHQIMKKVLTNEVAVQYSLHGKGIKRMLVDMKLCSCVRGKWPTHNNEAKRVLCLKS
jgi:hypothetical protein